MTLLSFLAHAIFYHHAQSDTPQASEWEDRGFSSPPSTISWWPPVHPRSPVFPTLPTGASFYASFHMKAPPPCLRRVSPCVSDPSIDGWLSWFVWEASSPSLSVGDGHSGPGCIPAEFKWVEPTCVIKPQNGCSCCQTANPSELSWAALGHTFLDNNVSSPEMAFFAAGYFISAPSALSFTSIATIPSFSCFCHTVLSHCCHACKLLLLRLDIRIGTNHLVVEPCPKPTCGKGGIEI